jgi:hypothetical protein
VDGFAKATYGKSPYVKELFHHSLKISDNHLPSWVMKALDIFGSIHPISDIKQASYCSKMQGTYDDEQGMKLFFIPIIQNK